MRLQSHVRDIVLQSLDDSLEALRFPNVTCHEVIGEQAKREDVLKTSELPHACLLERKLLLDGQERRLDLRGALRPASPRLRRLPSELRSSAHSRSQ